MVLADIATLVARYNVMESMYQNWSGMTIDANYEEALLSLCVTVLKCIDVIIESSLADSFDADILQTSMKKVNEADAVCRQFSVTFLDSVLERNVEDISDSDSDSEGITSDAAEHHLTLVAHE